MTSSISSMFPLSKISEELIKAQEDSIESQDYLFLGERHSRCNLASLEMTFPASFEFGGIRYPTALHAYLAQRYPDSPSLQERCSKATIQDLLISAIENGVTHPRWFSPIEGFGQEREKILFHVLKAKFGQNPECQDQLLSTLKTHLFFLSSWDSFWGIQSASRGKNLFAHLLMRTRKEYGEGGIPSSLTPKARIALNTWQNPSIPSLEKPDEEILAEIHKLNEKAEDPSQTSVCRRRENQPFNRFNDCNFVFNDTLVPLSSGQYINANFLYGSLLIGTQSPLPHTREHFWRMIIEHNVKVVIMLNYISDFEGHLYFPQTMETTHHYGEASLRLLENPSYETDPAWVLSEYEEYHAIRTYPLEVCLSGKVHQVQVLHYVNWRDFGVGHPACIAHLVQKTKQIQSRHPHPVVVHCKAGVGRTAVFAAIYEQYLGWKSGQKIDIKESVAKLRDPETGRYAKMVQAPEQYKLCYDTLRYLIQEDLKCRAAEDPIS